MKRQHRGRSVGRVMQQIGGVAAAAQSSGCRGRAGGHRGSPCPGCTAPLCLCVPVLLLGSGCCAGVGSSCLSCFWMTISSFISFSPPCQHYLPALCHTGAQGLFWAPQSCQAPCPPVPVPACKQLHAALRERGSQHHSPSTWPVTVTCHLAPASAPASAAKSRAREMRHPQWPRCVGAFTGAQEQPEPRVGTMPVPGRVPR